MNPIKFQNYHFTFLEGLSELNKFTYAGLCPDIYSDLIKPGSPFIITEDSKWHFITDVKKVRIGSRSDLLFFFSLSYKLSKESEFFPLNQFDRKVTNEEIYKAANINEVWQW